MWYVWETAEVRTQFWWGGMRKEDRLEDLEVNGKIALKWNFEKCDKVGVDWIDLRTDRWRALVMR
jgi:hypothetical protein